MTEREQDLRTLSEDAWAAKHHPSGAPIAYALLLGLLYTVALIAAVVWRSGIL